MQSDKDFFIVPNYNERNPKPLTQNIKFQSFDLFKKQFLAQHLDKVVVFLLFDGSEQTKQESQPIKQVLEQLSKTHPLLRFYSLDITEHPQLNEQFFKIEEVPSVVTISPLLQQKPHIVQDLSASNLNSVIQKSSEEFSKRFQQCQSKVYEEIEKQIKSNKIMMFIKGSPQQPKCKFTRALMEQFLPLNLQFASLNILDNMIIRQWLKYYTKWPTFPQVYVDGKFVGGIDIVNEMIQTGEFQELVKG